MLYKFRGNYGIKNKDFVRDIEMIKNDEIWCSNIENLNDPAEASFSLQDFEKNLSIGLKTLGFLRIKEFKNENVSNYKNALQNLMNVYMKSCGIYSMSKKIDNELMWAHYGNSHRGFCIEYEFKNLTDFGFKSKDKFSLDHFNRFGKVFYSNKIFSLRGLNTDYDNFIKFLFYKSTSWAYEEEYRIITHFYGVHKYDSKCLKSITFGLNMLDEDKQFILNSLEGKNIQFYQMKRKDGEYKFYRERL